MKRNGENYKEQKVHLLFHVSPKKPLLGVLNTTARVFSLKEYLHCLIEN